MGGQREILCIDDDPEGLKVRSILLESLGYKVTAEPDAERGLRSFRKHPFDVVVMDYEMPGMTGGEAARRMKQLRPATPVVILSALPWLPEEAPTEAIDAFVQKGEPLAVLSSSIEQALSKGIETAASPAATVGGAVGHFLGSLAQAMRW